MFEYARVDDMAVFKPALRRKDLRKIVAQVVEQNGRILETNCRLVDLLSTACQIVSTKADPEPVLSESFRPRGPAPKRSEADDTSPE